MDTPVPASDSHYLARLARLERAAEVFASNAISENTKKAYRSDWADFVRWCRENRAEALPASPSAVALYLTDRADTHKVSSLRRRQTAIAQAHKLTGLEPPTQSPEVRQVMAGITRTLGEAPERKAPALAETMIRMLEALPETLSGTRDRALLLLGYAGALRRSELVALTTRDLTFEPEGLRVVIRRSKTDPTGLGQTIGIPFGASAETCPVRSLRHWLGVSGIVDGPVFRRVVRGQRIGDRALTAQSVALIVKRAALAAGLDPDQYSAHSLRAGFATQAARGGAEERAIQRTTRHKSEKVLRTYIREGDVFRDNAGERIGL